MMIKISEQAKEKMASIKVSGEVLMEVLQTNIIDFADATDEEFVYILKWDKTLTLFLNKADGTIHVNNICSGRVLVNTGLFTKQLNE